MCSHRAIVSLLPPPASNQCGIGAVCVPIKLLSAYFLLLPPPSVELVQCVFPYSYCQPTSSSCLQSVWYWCCVCTNKAIVSLLPPPASTQCGVGAVCVPIELLSAYFLLLPPISVELVQCGVGAACVAIYGFESGGVWNMVLRLEVCGIWL